jgi:shikimate dehydrogenase
MTENKFKTFCIIGDPVNHSLSPSMHNAAFKHLDLNCTYIAFRVQIHELHESLNALRAIGISGFNVTMPHKVEVVRYVDSLDSNAKKTGAVNTVKMVDGNFLGYNTDSEGFITPLRKRGINFKGLTVLILGSGGACRAIVAALSTESEISTLAIASRNKIQSMQISELCNRIGLKHTIIPYNDIQDAAKSSDLIINSTPIGMHDEPSIIHGKNIRKDSIVYDIVYKPIETNLIKSAKDAGAQVIYGYEMLLEQACSSFRIWTKLSPPIEIMKRALLGRFGEPT